ncbi:MAG: hypothetical protein KAW81_01890 [Dehalococcoidia bacterium]|nr:hypothetical protein [Dehalococcoidia bacterium]
MAIRGRNLYLYLALACFVGIIAIFIADGYLGVYDTLYITVQEREREIEPDYWQQPRVDKYRYSIGAEWVEPVYFKYEIDSHCFSTYSTSVEASVWKSGEKIIELLNEDISIAAFDKVTVDWVLRAEALEEMGYGVGEYTIKIRRGEVEREIVLNYRYPAEPVYPEKMPPPPPG